MFSVCALLSKSGVHLARGVKAASMAILSHACTEATAPNGQAKCWEQNTSQSPAKGKSNNRPELGRHLARGPKSNAARPTVRGFDGNPSEGGVDVGLEKSWDDAHAKHRTAQINVFPHSN